MTTSKLAVYNVFDQHNQIIQNYFIKFKVAEYSANYLIHKNVLRHQILNKQGTASTKTKGEVRGGGRKPWKQKGTGNARAGSNRSPLWRGGGVIFGPKPKKYNFKLNKKERKIGIQTLFFNKHENTILLDNFFENWSVIKTKILVNILFKFNIKLNQKILLIVNKKTKALFLASRNIPNITLICAKNLNTLNLLKNQNIFITLAALNNIKEIYCD
jgi:large subunit ribosomal protein L4